MNSKSNDEMIKLLTDNKSVKIILLGWVFLMVFWVFSFVTFTNTNASTWEKLQFRVPVGCELTQINITTYNGSYDEVKGEIKVEEKDFEKVLNLINSVETGGMKSLNSSPNARFGLTYTDEDGLETLITLTFSNNYKYISFTGGHGRNETLKVENPEEVSTFFESLKME